MERNKNRLDFQAKLSRHTHDVSAGYSSSIVPGAIIPQYFHILGPGDTIYTKNHVFARLQDVITAFMGEVDIHLDSFFVPLQMLFTPFGQFFAQTNDFVSSALTLPSSNTGDFPMYDIESAVNSLRCNTGRFPDTSVGDCFGRESMRLLDAFDLNPLIVLSTSQKNAASYTPTPQDVDELLTHSPMISPWIIAAYQAIYQKYYRNDEFETLNVASYNFDVHSDQVSFSDSEFFYLQYCQRPSDYFTKVRVSPISSAVNKFAQFTQSFPSYGGSPDSVLLKVNSFLTSGGSTTPFQVFPQSFNSRVGVIASNASSNVDSGGAYEQGNSASLNQLSASNIRALFAVDKFARIYGRADKTYDDQILAHFGVQIPHDVKHDLTHISHSRVVLMSDPVVGTANVAASDEIISAIGQVGGQGSATFDSNEDKFTAPVHGVFMTVAYVVTKPRYYETFSKLHLLGNRLDFPIPEFDKLGAQPMYKFEALPRYLRSGQTSSRLGWQNRYSQFKSKYNRVSLCFYGGDYDRIPGSVQNVYAPWVISRSPFEYANTDEDFAYSFFETPKALNSVMAKQFEPAWSNSWFVNPHLAFQNDPIFLDFMCYAKLVSWMSETGDPNL